MGKMNKTDLLVSQQCRAASLQADLFSRRRNITLKNANEADVLR